VQAVLAAAILALTSAAANAASAPSCPTPAGEQNPLSATPGEPPVVRSWRDLSLPTSCLVSAGERVAIAVAFATRFDLDLTVEEIARRLGAISSTRGLLYWSVSDDSWQPLVADAFALGSPDPETARADFTSEEVLSGETLYFAQNDTRSWGVNVFSIETLESSPDRLVIESRNLSRIRIGPITIVGADDASTILFIDRQKNATWGYYSLAVVRKGRLASRERSLVNRQAAFYRLLIGQAADEDPPVAP